MSADLGNTEAQFAMSYVRQYLSRVRHFGQPAAVKQRFAIQTVALRDRPAEVIERLTVGRPCRLP